LISLPIYHTQLNLFSEKKKKKKTYFLAEFKRKSPTSKFPVFSDNLLGNITSKIVGRPLQLCI